MNARDLERYVVAQTPWGATDVEQRARFLRAARMLPTGGGRGVNAPDIEPDHAATFVLALAADRPADAAQAVIAYAPLEVASGRDYDGFDGQPTLGDAVAAILSDHQGKFGVTELVVCRSWPTARITKRWPDGRTQEFTYGYAAPEQARAAGVRVYVVRNETHFSGGFLHQLAIKLQQRGKRAARWAVDDEGAA